MNVKVTTSLSPKRKFELKVRIKKTGMGSEKKKFRFLGDSFPQASPNLIQHNSVSGENTNLSLLSIVKL